MSIDFVNRARSSASRWLGYLVVAMLQPEKF